MILKSNSKTTFPLPNQFATIKYLIILQREPGCLLIGVDHDGIMISAHHIKVGILKKYKIPAITNLLALGNHHILMQIAGMTVGIYEIRMANLEKIQLLSVQQFTTVSSYTIREIINKIIEVQLFFNDRDILIYQFSQVDGRYGMVRYQTDTLKILFETQNGLHKTKYFLNSKKGELFSVNAEKKTIEKTKIDPAKSNQLFYIGIPGQKEQYVKFSIKNNTQIELQNVINNRQIIKIIEKDLKFPENSVKNCIVKTHLDNVLLFYKEQSNFLRILYQLKTTTEHVAKIQQRTRYCYEFFWVKRNQLLVMHPNKCRVSLEQFSYQKQTTQLNYEQPEQNFGMKQQVQGWKPAKVLQKNQVSTSKTVCKSKQPEPIQHLRNTSQTKKEEQRKNNQQGKEKYQKQQNMQKRQRAKVQNYEQNRQKNIVQEKSEQLISSIKQKIQLQDQAINRIINNQSPILAPAPKIFNFDYNEFYRIKQQQIQEKLLEEIFQQIQEYEEIELQKQKVQNQKIKIANNSPIKNVLNFCQDCKLPPTNTFSIPQPNQANQLDKQEVISKQNDDTQQFLEQFKDFKGLQQNIQSSKCADQKLNKSDPQQKTEQNPQSQISMESLQTQHHQNSRSTRKIDKRSKRAIIHNSSMPQYEIQLRKLIKTKRQEANNLIVKQRQLQQQMQRIQYSYNNLLQKIPKPCGNPIQFQEKQIIEQISQHIYKINSQFIVNEATNMIEKGFQKIYLNQWETLSNNSCKVITEEIKLNEAIINKIVKQKEKLLNNYQKTISTLIQQDKKQMKSNNQSFINISKSIQQTKSEIIQIASKFTDENSSNQAIKQCEKIKQKHQDFLGKVKGVRERIQNTLKNSHKPNNNSFKSVITKK